MQHGGRVLANMLNMVGENIFTRPEYFMSDRGGYMLTKQDAQEALAEKVNMKGGDTYQMNVYTNAPLSTVIQDFGILRAWAKG